MSFLMNGGLYDTRCIPTRTEIDLKRTLTLTHEKSLSVELRIEKHLSLKEFYISATMDGTSFADDWYRSDHLSNDVFAQYIRCLSFVSTQENSNALSL